MALPLPGSLDITSYQIYICNNKLTPIGLSGDQDPAGKKCAVQLGGIVFRFSPSVETSRSETESEGGMRTKGEDGGINAQMSRSSLWLLCPCQM